MTRQEGVLPVGDLGIRYVRAGSGARTVVLVHDWPQSSYAWRAVVPLLEERYTVITLDLRGVGGSSVTPAGYDKLTLAHDVRGLVEGLRRQSVVVVGHGVGGMVAHAYGRAFPAGTAGVVVVDTPLPGLAGWDAAVGAYPAWHIGFHRDVNRAVGVADVVIAGHESFYLRSYIDRFAAHPERITDDDVAVYAAAYGEPSRLRAGFEMFRTFPLDVEANRRAHGRLEVPYRLVFGEFSYATLLDPVAEGLRDTGVRSVSTSVVPDAGHWPAEENPEGLAAAISSFVDSLTDRPG